MEQTGSDFQLITVIVHDRGEVVGLIATGTQKKSHGRCINVSVLSSVTFVLP